ncbi:hypothetical protein BMF94_3459 [Rhodotorula taiwanensis]|uniref:BTB domain-containing protein n=1 Tax=Rhodotorula taiwanensis TaxID=741276 RepID=A0A2S5B9S8_9BASI|nr:hypothetical protein BMF94_3459 [Rhodotorula taiwanensis]
MSVKIEAADTNKALSAYLVGDLPSIRAKLCDAGVHKGFELHAVFHNKRFGIEWSNAHSDLYITQGTLEIKVDVWSEETNKESYASVEVRVCFEVAVHAPGSAASMAALIDCAALATLQQTQNDVRFVFPSPSKDLWASSSRLRTASSYFETLLSSSFEEGQMKLDADPMQAELVRQRDFDDSDDETDEIAEGSAVIAAATPTSAAAPHSTVRVSQTARATYAALLLWLATRTIDFAPLRSSGGSSRKEHIKEALQMRPTRPAPVSPKSVYRLAHLLDLEPLKSLALAKLTAELNVANAASELFSDVASSYPAIRDAALNFVVAKRAAVLASHGWRLAETRAGSGSLPPASVHTALLLARRLA